ncbi:alpha/beta hydrolase [soil metagenome]
MKKIIKRLILFILIFYGIICIGVYYFQEKLLFFPQKLTDDFQFQFTNSFEEVNIESPTGSLVNGLFFSADSSKGIIVYFHGNSGSLESWGSVYEDFLPLYYSLLIIDYAGYGKSKGELSEENLFKDAQAVYDFAKSRYSEDKIIIYGRSIGTGIAAHLASKNMPKHLVLEAPYFSMKDLSTHIYPFLPSFLLRYLLRTDLFFPQVKCNVTIFHGTDDEVIYPESSAKLRELFKPGDRLFFIKGGHHNDLKNMDEYRDILLKTLL